MREIKFRAWDRITQKMHDGNAIIGPRADMNVTTTMPSIFRVNEFFFELSKGLTLMQFTGLHDKNGKEIYEGDLITGADSAGVRQPPRVVNFENVGGWTASGLGLWAVNDPEVIGNIYETPAPHK